MQVTDLKITLEGKIEGVTEELTRLGANLKGEINKNTDKLASIDDSIKDLIKILKARAT